MDGVPCGAQTRDMDPRIASVTAEMDRRLAEPISMSDLAAEINLSTSRFRHLFRAETGMSPARYLRMLRMERACALLEHSLLSIKEIMAAVGCNDPSHFARDFRRQHGLTPSAWRHALGAQTNEPVTRRIRDPGAGGQESGSVPGAPAGLRSRPIARELWPGSPKRPVGWAAKAASGFKSQG